MVVFLGGIILSYLTLAAATLVVGLVFIETILPLGGLEEADASAVEWLVDERTPTLNDVSFFGSEISGGIVLPILVVVIAIGFAIRRHWRAAVFALFCVALESATYRTTVMFVDRERPDVPRLDDLPPDASFPSGHVAASIAVYGGLALLITSRLTSGVHRAIVWGIAVAIPLVVGVSRMYRGMHHPLDTLAGVLIGIAALALVVFVARVTGVVARAREHATAGREPMSTVAVIAHAGKTFGGGLVELRRELEKQGVADPLWFEVPKSRKAPKQVKRALDGRRGSSLRLGRGRDGAALHRRPLGFQGHDRDRAGGHCESLRLQSRDSAGHRRRRCASGSRALGARSTSGA